MTIAKTNPESAKRAAGARRSLDEQGLNTGPSPSQLGNRFITPAELFFTRSHAAIPSLDAASWRLRVHGLVGRKLELSLDDLKHSFTAREVDATLVCAGLRRTELETVAPIPGELPWGLEPISTGTWRGIQLRDVMLSAGIDEDAGHVWFTSLDVVERHGKQFAFGGSIPLAKALGPEVLLAYELNGEPLSPDHGFPVRALVPGYIGARSVKWLGEIEVRAEPSANYFQTQAYRLLAKRDGEDGSVRNGTEMNETPLNAVILSPEAGGQVPAGAVELSGWALGREGSPVMVVECSGDGGDTWTPAEVYASGSPWAWQLWRATLTLAAGSHTLVVRCSDGRGLTQPPDVKDVWNVKGYGNNAWHRVAVEARA